jgi:hypothetical protein
MAGNRWSCGSIELDRPLAPREVGDPLLHQVMAGQVARLH